MCIQASSPLRRGQRGQDRMKTLGQFKPLAVEPQVAKVLEIEITVAQPQDPLERRIQRLG